MKINRVMVSGKMEYLRALVLVAGFLSNSQKTPFKLKKI